MRKTLALLLALIVAGCADYKYTDTPKATGPWIQANGDPDSTDNNLVPLDDVEGLK